MFWMLGAAVTHTCTPASCALIGCVLGRLPGAIMRFESEAWMRTLNLGLRLVSSQRPGHDITLVHPPRHLSMLGIPVGTYGIY